VDSVYAVILLSQVVTHDKLSLYICTFQMYGPIIRTDHSKTSIHNSW